MLRKGPAQAQERASSGAITQPRHKRSRLPRLLRTELLEVVARAIAALRTSEATA